jgi:hypothetical protein
MTDRDELIELLRKCTAYTEPLLADVILEAGFHKRPAGIPLSALLAEHHGGIEITRHEPDCTWEELKE